MQELNPETKTNDPAIPMHHGMLYSILNVLKEHIVMGDLKSAGHKIHEALRFMEEKFISEYYKISNAFKEETKETENSSGDSGVNPSN